MIRSLTMLGALALATTTSMVFAQQAGQQPPARGLEMALAVEAAQAGSPLYALPTYTAMLSLRELLVARGEANSAWA